MKFPEALTFDDVLLVPARSDVLPADTDTATRLTRTIDLGIPLISAAMDTVTESKLAIAMAQAGGIGVIHKNLTPQEQAGEVRAVKKFESGMIVNPFIIAPGATLADALRIKESHNISGIPVVEKDSGLLVGILTNRDVRFADNMEQPVSELMTPHTDEKPLITVSEDIGHDDAKRLLHKYRIEKLLVVDGDFRCVGLMTVKDIEKAQAHPDACKDEKGSLRVAAATGVGDEGVARAEALLDAGADVIVVDTAHGHSTGVLAGVERIKKLSNYAQVIAGNVATTDGAQALIDAGADCIKIGMLHRPDIIETVCRMLDQLAPDVPVVVDPVMVAKGGASLLAEDAMAALKENMVPRAAILTPNIPEAEALAGRAAPGLEDAEGLARSLLDLGPKAVLLKGGHRDDAEVMDLLIDAAGARLACTDPFRQATGR